MTDTRKWRASLAALAIATAFLNLYQLAKGQRSEYYAAIAVSMSKSLSNFIFGALDPAGTVTLDKIPGSYWIPAIFVKIFGFSTWAVNAPNALAGIAAVIITAVTVKNLYGKTAGILAGALVATTPVLTAVVRSNQPQTFFLLSLSLTLWAASKALTTSSRRWLVIAGAFIALGFHTYMLVAWAVWPALIVAYFFTDQSLSKKLKDLLISGTTSLALSMTWIMVALLTPASSRPYIGGTYRNNPIEMVFGYNGLGRFSQTSTSLSSATDDPTFRSFTPPFSGGPSFTRLFNDQVAGQIAWLLPAAFVAGFAAMYLARKNPFLIFNFAWLITFYIMFSAVSGMHQFYVSALAFPIATLIASTLALAHRRQDWIVPTLLLGVTGVWTLRLTDRYSDYFSWTSKVQFLLMLLSLVVFSLNLRMLSFLLPLTLIAGLAFTPTVWALDVHNRPSSINPIAGPETKMGGPGGPRPNFQPGQRPQFGGGMQGGPGRFGGPGGSRGPGGFGEQNNTELISYLQNNRSGAKYLLATFGGMSAAPFITSTGDNVMPIGGFDGQDPTPTLDKFTELVKNGDIKFVLVGGGGGRQQDADNEISRWVESNCTIDTNAPNSSSLYRCGN